MPTPLEQVTKGARALPARERLALVAYLLQTAEGAADSEAETRWDSELQDRIRAIDEGRQIGVSYDDVMREADNQLAQGRFVS
jgi:putative addiction module component (TIGR02574 family)